MPKRIQRKRTRGWKMPAGAVYVGRPTCWGNSFKVDKDCTPEQAVEQYGRMARASEYLRAFAYQQLRGKDLVCWCPLVDKDGKPVPCHADVLLEIANK